MSLVSMASALVMTLMPTSSGRDPLDHRPPARQDHGIGTLTSVAQPATTLAQIITNHLEDEVHLVVSLHSPLGETRI